MRWCCSVVVCILLRKNESLYYNTNAPQHHNTNSMIIITGAAGFIGSCLAAYLNEVGHQDLILVDDFISRPDKLKNLAGVHCRERISRDLFIEKWFAENAAQVDFVFHLGARTDTTETNVELFNRLNLNYSKSVWHICAKHNIPLVYASSAATYGSGELGYKDDHAGISQLKPLNPYGDSKQDFDAWVLRVSGYESSDTGRVGETASKNPSPPFWAGLKFFNVYGPNEYHKGRMASVVFHCFNQVKNTGAMKLFRSHKPDIVDGHQARDFIYVMDVVKVCAFFIEHQQHSGIYNLGTGTARTFLDLVTQTFLSMGLLPNISFIDTPEDIRDTYQYFTEAQMDKLRAIGYDSPFYSLEDGIREYVQAHLSKLPL